MARRVADKLSFTYRGPTSVYGSDDMGLYALTKDAALKQDAVRPLTRR